MVEGENRTCEDYGKKPQQKKSFKKEIKHILTNTPEVYFNSDI